MSDEIKMDVGLKELIALDRECWRCHGRLNVRDATGVVCEVCGGAGYQPTGAGSAIMKLIARHGATS